MSTHFKGSAFAHQSNQHPSVTDQPVSEQAKPHKNKVKHPPMPIASRVLQQSLNLGAARIDPMRV